MYRNTLIYGCSALALLAAQAIPGFAGEGDAHVKSISYTATSGATLHVVSSDGKTWNGFKPGNVGFNADIKVDTRWPGYVEEVAVVLGHCGGSQCAGMPIVWGTLVGKRDFDRQVSLYFPSDRIPIGNGGIPVIPDGPQILGKCNQHLAADGPTKKHTFQHEMWTTVAVGTGKVALDKNMVVEATEGIPFPTDVDQTRSDKITINVVCDPVIKSPTNDLAAAEPDFKVKDIKVRLMTMSIPQPTSNPGTKCQQTTARVRVATTKAGPVKFKLWTKLGNETTSQFVEAWSSHQGPGKYEAVFDKKLTTTKTVPVQIMAEDMTNPIGQSSGWKLGKLNCTGAGGGGLADASGSNSGDDPIIPSLAVTGNLSLGTKPGAGPTKPRHATVVMRLWSNKPGPTSYKLTCTGGHEWSGSVATNKVASGKYQGSLLKTVYIDKTTQLACAVRSTSMAGNPVVALASKQYVVIERNPDVKGPGDLTAPPRTTHKPVAKPTRVIVKRAPPVETVKPKPVLQEAGKDRQQPKRVIVLPKRPMQRADLR